MTTKKLEIPVPERAPAELLLRHSMPAQDWQLATPRPILRVGGMSPYRPTRREFLIGTGSLLVLAPYGCSGSGQNGDGSGAASGIEIEHDAGRAMIEAPVKRVAAISDEVADLFAALGVEPMGLASTRVSGTPGEPIGDSYYVDIGEPVYLGQAESPSVERLAGLQPELVVMATYGADDVYELLSEVAPTLAYDVGSSSGWWRQPLIDVGRATGREDRAREFIDDYDAHVEELREKVAPVVESSPRLAVLYAPDASTTFVFDERGAPADPHAKLGFKLVVPEGVEIPEEGFAQISPEIVGEMNVDTIIVLRPTSEETPKRLPLDDLLDSLAGEDSNPRVLRQVIDPTRPSSSPVADKQAIEQAAALLLDRG